MTSQYEVALGFPEEVRRDIFEKTFPELANISPSSSREEREIALQRLKTRLGVPSTREE
jgi:Ni,Fe-hydrogenase III component G